jgi:hypothetical protein
MQDHRHIFRNGKFTDMLTLRADETNSECVSVDVIVTYDHFTQEPRVGARVNDTPLSALGRDSEAIPPVIDG